MFDIFLDKELHKESDTVQNGNKADLIKTKHGTFGHTICYDIRFPHMNRKLSQAGAQILLVPAAFTKVTGKAHWHILNRARAIENISFVISACSFGKIAGGGECYGHSLIIDPWGKVLKDGGKGIGLIDSDGTGNKLRIQHGAGQSYLYETQGTFDLEDLDGNIIVKGSAGSVGQGGSEILDEQLGHKSIKLRNSITKFKRSEQYLNQEDAWTEMFTSFEKRKGEKES